MEEKANIRIYLCRDELDSAAQVKNQVADSGDAPLRPNHVKRPSGALQKDLETIQEDLASAKMFDDLSSSKEDTVVPNTVKEVLQCRTFQTHNCLTMMPAHICVDMLILYTETTKLDK